MAARKRHTGPDLLDLLANLDKPQAIALDQPEPGTQFCPHTKWEQMNTGGARFVKGRWVHAACLLPFTPLRRYR